VHVWSRRQRWGQDERRHLVAQASWAREYGTGQWLSLPVDDAQLRRNAKSALRDPRRLPFLRDLLDAAMRHATPADLVVFTNDDVLFACGLTETLFHVAQAAFASRHEFIRLPTQPTCLDIISGRKHCGCDLFAMTPHWWRTHRRDYPDMVVGCEALDLVMRKLMLATGGIELHAALAHEEHASWWITHRGDPAAHHNRKLASDWLAQRGLPWE